MPTYEAHCSACAASFDFISPIATRNKVPKCVTCGSKRTSREYRTAAGVAMDQDWSSENGGRGRFIDGLAKVSPDGSSYDQKDPNAFCQSQRDALNKCSKRGLTATKT